MVIATHDDSAENLLGKELKTQTVQPAGNGFGKRVRRESARHETGKRDSHLNRGQKTAGISHQIGQPASAPSAFGPQPPDRRRLQRDQRDFGGSEERIQQNQKPQKKQLQQQ